MLKRAELAHVYGQITHEHLVYNDLQKSQILSGCPHIARVFHHERSPTHIILVVEAYSVNLKEFLDQVNNGVTEIDTFEHAKIFKQLFTALQFMHNRNIVHRDVRAKNMYIQKYGGKFSCILNIAEK